MSEKKRGGWARYTRLIQALITPETDAEMERVLSHTGWINKSAFVRSAIEEKLARYTSQVVSDSQQA